MLARRRAASIVTIIAALISGSHFAAAAELPSFPGAEGWGRHASGGRAADAKVLFVTSLEDDGPGTLRAALTAKGPRIVVFKIGGVIELKKSIFVGNPNITIAGQTAPGDGIIVKNYWIRIGADNVIVRGLRVRPGDAPGAAGDQRDSISLGTNNAPPKQNIMIDRCSFGWSIDETMEFWFGVQNVTVSNNIFSEALWESIHPKGKHGYAMLIGNKPNHQITVYRNLFAHNERRNPWVKGNAKVEVVNNVVYNWGTEGIGLWGSEEKVPSAVNVIGNYLKAGPDTQYLGQRGGRGINLSKPAIDGSRFFLRGNIGPNREKDEGDEWATTNVGDFDVAKFRSDELLKEADSGLTVLSAGQAYERVLNEAGAIPRDAADSRAVQNARDGTGHKIDKLSDIGGYPAYSPGQAAADADHDGIPDAWETAHGLNPQDPADATKFGEGGYLNIEAYVNSRFETPSARQ